MHFLLNLRIILNARKRNVARSSKVREHIVVNAQRFNFKFHLIFILVIASFTCNGQNHGIQLFMGLNRLDYLIGIGYSQSDNAFQLETNIEFGSVSTFVQVRLNPRLSIELTYYPIQTKKIHIGPSIGYAYSFLQVNKNTQTYHHWHELLVGYSFEFGDKWRFVHQGMASVVNERFKGQVTNSSVNYTNFGFYARFGVKYCW